MKENQFLEVMRKHSEGELLEVFVENVMLKLKRTMNFVFKTMLLLEGFVLLCSCDSKKPSSTILLNDSLISTVPEFTATTQKGIIDMWRGEPIRKSAEKVLLSNRYDEEATKELSDSLKCLLLYHLYGRYEIVEHYRQYHNAVNDYLDDYITTNFYTQTSFKSLEAEELEFSLDTFRIDETCRLIMFETSIGDNSILSHQYLYRFYAEDYLIYKYYIKVEELLKDEDKNKLRLSQEQWESSLKADWLLEGTTMNSKYTGGGSIWKNVTFVNKRSRSEFLFRIYKHLKSLE